MTKQEIEFRDPVVQSVVNKFVDRSDVGFAKYGKTLRDDSSDVFAWLNHLQEELMDATLYLQRLKEEITNLREEKALLRELNDIDVIDAFEVKVKKKKTRLKHLNCTETNLTKKNGRGDNESVKKFGDIDIHLNRLQKMNSSNFYSIQIDD
jgi:hypothetical protein